MLGSRVRVLGFVGNQGSSRGHWEYLILLVNVSICILFVQVFRSQDYNALLFAFKQVLSYSIDMPLILVMDVRIQ
jgi:hypothetical protein